jgi:hypothetical protein
MSLPTGDKAVMELTIDNKLQAEKESYCDNLNKKIDRLIKKQKMFHLNLVTGRQQYRCIVPKLCIESKVLLNMGEFVARNI